MSSDAKIEISVADGPLPEVLACEDKGVTLLARQKGEKAEWHRGFLLYAVQDPKTAKKGSGRSLRAVSRALARDESSIRQWCKKMQWNRRIRETGGGVQSLAMRMYREMYLSSKGRIELEVLRARINVRIFDDEPWGAPPESAEKLPDPDAPPGSPAARRRNGRPANPLEARLRKQGEVYDSVIKQAADDIKKGKLKITARDLPFVFQAKEHVERRLDELAGKVKRQTQARVIESFRVRQARATGGDVMMALAADAHDLSLTFKAITNQADADQQHSETLMAQSEALALKDSVGADPAEA